MRIFKGDDTGGTLGKRLVIKIHSKYDLTGCLVIFTYQGVTRKWENVHDGDNLEIFFSHNETMKMSVGTFKGVLFTIDAAGKYRTINHAVPIEVTTDLKACYGADELDATVGQSIDWENVINKPFEGVEVDLSTDDKKLAALGTIIEKLGGTVKTLAIFAISALAGLSGIAYEPEENTNTFTRSGVTYAQRGGLGNASYVVTNVQMSAGDVGAVVRDETWESVSNKAMTAIQTLEPATNYTDEATGEVYRVSSKWICTSDARIDVLRADYAYGNTWIVVVSNRSTSVSDYIYPNAPKDAAVLTGESPELGMITVEKKSTPALAEKLGLATQYDVKAEVTAYHDDTKADLQSGKLAVSQVPDLVHLGDGSEWTMDAFRANQISVGSWDEVYAAKQERLTDFLSLGRWNYGVDKFIQETAFNPVVQVVEDVSNRVLNASVYVGRGATANSNDGTAIGHSANAGGNAFAAGVSADARENNSVAIGRQAVSTNESAVALGARSRSHGPNTFSVSSTVGNWYAGDVPLVEALQSRFIMTNVEEVVTNEPAMFAASVRGNVVTNTYKVYVPDGTGARIAYDDKSSLARMVADAATNNTEECECISTNLCKLISTQIEPVNAIAELYDQTLSALWELKMVDGEMMYTVKTNEDTCALFVANSVLKDTAATNTSWKVHVDDGDMKFFTYQ